MDVREGARGSSMAGDLNIELEFPCMDEDEEMIHINKYI